MVELVNLRSDTMTRPGPEMRAAMAGAEVGDDVFEEDPTVNKLQEAAAVLMGKEAGLFTPSGTMSNTIAIKCLCPPGNEVLMDAEAHSMLYEAGAPASLAQALTWQFTSVRGIPNMAELEARTHTESLHSAQTSLIILENTHNRGGGAVIPPAVMAHVRAFARLQGISVHLDGARIFNAAIALGIPVHVLAAEADTVTFCLSKGLGCPVGSVLCGSRDFIARARRVRKMLGGGMRQAGILAAAGLYALKNNIERLAEDHAHARRLARGLADAPGVSLDVQHPATNMVYFNTAAPAAQFTASLRVNYGVLCSATGLHRIRTVTHLDVDSAGIDRAVEAVRAVGAALQSAPGS